MRNSWRLVLIARLFCLAAIVLCAAVSQGRAADAAPDAPELAARVARVAAADPGAGKTIGLFEILRWAGQSSSDGSNLLAPALADAHDPLANALQELVCWRMLPAGEAELATFRHQVSLLRQREAGGRWLSIFTLYLALRDNDRAALLLAADAAKKPDFFPAAQAEGLQVELLVAADISRAQAGLEVITHRDESPLHALLDLDRGLTREADFLRSTNGVADAARLETCRDRLRDGYLNASRHLVPRLFALNLLEKKQQAELLLEKSRKIAYLNDAGSLGDVLARVDPDRAWKELVGPLLENELQVIDAPPALGRFDAAAAKVEMSVQAKVRSVRPGLATYEGNVQASVGALTIAADRVAIVTSDGGAAALMTGAGAVNIRGVPGMTGGMTSDHFSFNTETGSFTLGGDVRLTQWDRPTILRACTITRAGDVRETQSYLQDFKAAKNVDERIRLLPAITKIYRDEELPNEVRYLLALSLVNPHLEWHDAHEPPREIDDVQQFIRRTGSSWNEAHAGESWMWPEREKAREAARAELRNKDAAPQQLDDDRPGLYWLLNELGHPDVGRAMKLLSTINTGELAAAAERWASELRRNNTVLTFDVVGAYPKAQAARVLLDSRAADRVSLKLYRVRSPQNLVAIVSRVGEDFIFRDHNFQESPKEQISCRALERMGLQANKNREYPPLVLDEKDLQCAWEIRPADLARTNDSTRQNDDWDDDYGAPAEGDSEYFGDDCGSFSERLHRTYREGRQTTAWNTGRIVEIPGDLIKEAGSYVMVAEANGQRALAPILVDPPAMTLRRCRDGVFAIVSDDAGKTPLAGVTLNAPGSLRPETTDKAGVAFLKVRAAGDVPIIASAADGRAAVGGFGRIFDGVYVSAWERESRPFYQAMQRAQRMQKAEQLVNVYEDRTVIAGYTDRPTYRPGQEVNFKLIVRQLAENQGDPVPAAGFRESDFNLSSRLQLPKAAPLHYAVLNPQGRSVAEGSVDINDFGTAAGRFNLNEQSVAGIYSLRVAIGGDGRIIPNLFSVNFYRRPNFEVKLDGVPDRAIKSKESLALHITGQYYFGKPVAGGNVELQVVRAGQRKSIVHANALLDSLGSAEVPLQLPVLPEGEKYQLIASLTDASGQTVSTAASFETELTQPASNANPLSRVPRFAAVHSELEIKANHLTVTRQDPERVDTESIKAIDGIARVRFEVPGWYTLREGAHEAPIFIYGGIRHPRALGGDEESKSRAGWVNLSAYDADEAGGDGTVEQAIGQTDDAAQHVWALFDSQQATVGQTLRVLIYAPDTHGRLLLTIEGRTVIDYVVLEPELEASLYRVVEIPIKPRFAPNFYLQARFLSEPREPALSEETRKAIAEKQQKAHADEEAGDDPRWCRIDVIDPNAKAGGERLNVEIKTERGVYAPGDEVAVTLRATDLSGQPTSAEFSLAAVDESLFSFGEDHSASAAAAFGDARPVRRFFAKSWRTSGGADDGRQRLVSLRKAQAQAQAAQLMQQAAKQEIAIAETPPSEERPAVPPVQGMLPATNFPLAALRTDFRETAAWMPQLRTGKDGIAHTAFKLPESLTAYRLTAVGLTQQTEIGTARASVHVSKPLAVQVFTPRFALEKDRLLAVALVHNNTDSPISCDVIWDISGTPADADDADHLAWDVSHNDANTALRARIQVPARESTRVGAWINPDVAGSASLSFRATEVTSHASDGERRIIPIHALGRPAEVNLNGDLHGTERVKLPDRFVAQELKISVTRNNIAGALDGLGYLVEFPYGCVEQTMSRFLPATLVADASKHIPAAALPHDIAKRLPDVLSRGLARLYNFQHADGGWGWYEKDKTDDRMSIYVVDGLARCRNTGSVAVNSEVLDRGCTFIRGRLAANALSPDLAARAWYALAVAGNADRAQLLACARAFDAQAMPASGSQETACLLALACKSVGMNEEGRRLWKRLADWNPQEVQPAAMKLIAQLQFDEPFEKCLAQGNYLLSLRQGNRWANTEATAWAIQSLAGLLAYTPNPSSAKAAEIAVGGRSVLKAADAIELQRLVHRARVEGDAATALGEGAEIAMTLHCDDPCTYAISAIGTERLDRVEQSGTDVRLHRRYLTADGKPLADRAAKVGEVIAVELVLELTRPMNYLLVEDFRPAGCEFAADELTSPPDLDKPADVEFRDDRLCISYAALPAGRHVLTYYLRAESEGLSHVLPGRAYPMYQETVRGETGSAVLSVQRK